MTHATTTHAADGRMEGTMTANGRQNSCGLEGAMGLRNATPAGRSLAQAAYLARRPRAGDSRKF